MEISLLEPSESMQTVPAFLSVYTFVMIYGSSFTLVTGQPLHSSVSILDQYFPLSMKVISCGLHVCREHAIIFAI